MAYDYRVSCPEWTGAKYFDSLQTAREFVAECESELTITNLENRRHY